VAEELGKITRPEPDQFKGKRKLYIIPLLYSGPDSPPEYKHKYELYWLQVNEQITTQESKMGKIARIYHETIPEGGKEGYALLEKMGVLSYLIIKEKMEKGAVLESTEIADLVEECMDWERCLFVGLYSEKVASTIAANYHEAAKKRYEHIGKHIDETLKEGEVALLFIREGHSVQFPKDIDVFVVAPPELDDIHRWLRDRQAAARNEGKME
jgi:hypothetical protein